MPSFECLNCNHQLHVTLTVGEVSCPHCGSTIRLGLVDEPEPLTGAADERKLGRLVAEYGSSSGSKIFKLSLGSFLLIVGCLMLSMAASLGFREKRWFEALTGFSSGMILLVLGLMLLVDGINHREVLARVREHAVELIEPEAQQSMRWDEIEFIQEGRGGLSINGIPMYKRHGFILVGIDGTKMSFTHNIDRIDDLTEMVHEEIVVRRLPMILQDLRAGQSQ